MNFHWDYSFESLSTGIRYYPNTLKLVFIPAGIGLIIGTVIAFIRIFKVPVLGKLFGIFITIYRGIPIVVALMIYNLLFTLKFNDVARFFGIKTTVADVDNIIVGLLALTLMAICLMTESIRGALLSINKGQYEAGYSVGMTKVQTLYKIIIPQLIPVSIPPLTNNIIGIVKGSSVVMAIGITEILAGSLIPSSKNYGFLEGYIAAAVIYWIFTMLLEKISSLLEKRGNKFGRSLT